MVGWESDMRMTMSPTHMIVEEMEEDAFILVTMDNECGEEDPHDVYDNYLSDIDNFIATLSPVLWPLNRFIHETPELAFEEHKAHEALTTFMQSQDNWRVTKSAYGMETAWVASYESGKLGPTVSFNVEMGTLLPLHFTKT